MNFTSNSGHKHTQSDRAGSYRQAGGVFISKEEQTSRYNEWDGTEERSTGGADRRAIEDSVEQKQKLKFKSSEFINLYLLSGRR